MDTFNTIYPEPGSTAGEFEGIPDQFDSLPRRQQHNGYNVKPRRAAAKIPFRQIMEGYAGNLLLLPATHGEQRVAVRFGAPALDLDKDQGSTLLGHNIDLAEETSIIPFDDPETHLRQILRSQILTLFPRALSCQ
jgi:hypothetical protein